MRFEEAFDLWQSRTLTQEEAALLLGICDRSFRRYIDRYEDDGLQGLIDKRMEQVSHPTGICMWVIDFVSEHLLAPHRSGTPLGQREGVRLRYADMRIETYAARSMP